MYLWRKARYGNLLFSLNQTKSKQSLLELFL